MYETYCSKCKKIIGFANKKFYRSREAFEMSCIDCYFSHIKGILQENKLK